MSHSFRDKPMFVSLAQDTAAQDWPAECSMASTSPGAVPLMNMSEISSPDHNLLAPNDSASNYCLSPPLSRKEDPITISTPANQPGSRERALYAINDPSLATISQPPQIAVHSQVMVQRLLCLVRALLLLLCLTTKPSTD